MYSIHIDHNVYAVGDQSVRAWIFCGDDLLHTVECDEERNLRGFSRDAHNLMLFFIAGKDTVSENALDSFLQTWKKYVK
jgi:hypothetical protein